MECPAPIFEKLVAALEAGQSDDSEVMMIAYDALCDVGFTGAVRASLPALKVELLQNWGELEAWLNSTSPPLDVENVIPPDVIWCDDDSPSPSKYFGSLTDLKARTVRAIEEREGSSVAYSKISNRDRSLYLIYDDMDAWGMGYAEYVGVVESLDKLNEERGYYYP